MNKKHQELIPLVIVFFTLTSLSKINLLLSLAVLLILRLDKKRWRSAIRLDCI